jgi:hypothetical protein
MPGTQTKVGPEQSSLQAPRHGNGEWLAPIAAFLAIVALVLASICIMLGSRI